MWPACLPLIHQWGGGGGASYKIRTTYIKEISIRSVGCFYPLPTDVNKTKLPVHLYNMSDHPVILKIWSYLTDHILHSSP